VEASYRKGELLTGELKKMAITLLQEYVKGFQEQRKDVTDEVLRQYMTPRKLEWKGNPNPNPNPKEMKPKESKEEKDVKQAKS
jgi:tryptophanyl-tRNA synthetase